MLGRISEFYDGMASSKNILVTGAQYGKSYTVEKDTQLSRASFALGTVIAVVYTIKAVIVSAFLLIATLVSAAQLPKLNDALCKSTYDMPTYLLAALFGYLGIIFPGTIQSRVLDIQSHESFQTTNLFSGNVLK